MWSQCCLLHQWGVPPPATKDRDSKVGMSTDPIISTEAPQPTVSGISLSVPITPRHSTHSTKGVPPGVPLQDMQCLVRTT